MGFEVCWLGWGGSVSGFGVVCEFCCVGDLLVFGFGFYLMVVCGLGGFGDLQ